MSIRTPFTQYHIKIKNLERGDTVRDLGVIFDEKLTFMYCIHCKINMAYKMVGLIKRNFKYLPLSSFVLVYKNLVRSQLDYVTVYKHHVESRISKPWRRYKKATKLLPKIRHLKYADRLQTCKLLIFVFYAPSSYATVW